MGLKDSDSSSQTLIKDRSIGDRQARVVEREIRNEIYNVILLLLFVHRKLFRTGKHRATGTDRKCKSQEITCMCVCECVCASWECFESSSNRKFCCNYGAGIHNDSTWLKNRLIQKLLPNRKCPTRDRVHRSDTWMRKWKAKTLDCVPSPISRMQNCVRFNCTHRSVQFHENRWLQNLIVCTSIPIFCLTRQRQKSWVAVPSGCTGSVRAEKCL